MREGVERIDVIVGIEVVNKEIEKKETTTTTN